MLVVIGPRSSCDERHEKSVGTGDCYPDASKVVRNGRGVALMLAGHAAISEKKQEIGMVGRGNTTSRSIHKTLLRRLPSGRLPGSLRGIKLVVVHVSSVLHIGGVHRKI